MKEVPTLRDFAPRFIDGYAKANRLKPSGVAGKKSILSVHLIPMLGDKRPDVIQTEDIQRLKSAMGDRALKTVNNVLTALSVMLKTAAEWELIERVPCTIKLLKPKNAASLHDFDEYERLVEAAKADRQAQLVVLLGGEAGLRCVEMMALEWSDVDLSKRQLCVARSEWKGHVTDPKGGLFGGVRAAVACPGNGFETLLIDVAATFLAHAESTGSNAHECEAHFF